MKCFHRTHSANIEVKIVYPDYSMAGIFGIYDRYLCWGPYSMAGYYIYTPGEIPLVDLLKIQSISVKQFKMYFDLIDCPLFDTILHL